MEIIAAILIGYLGIGTLLAIPSASLKEFFTIMVIYPVILALIFIDIIETLSEELKKDASK